MTTTPIPLSKPRQLITVLACAPAHQASALPASRGLANLTGVTGALPDSWFLPTSFPQLTAVSFHNGSLSGTLPALDNLVNLTSVYL